MIPSKLHVVDMSLIQRRYYKSILERNFIMLADNSLGKKRTTCLRNVLIELRKCCNHPLLVGQQQLSPEDFANTDVETLIAQSGKLELVDRMLHMLKRQGHRVLIYSQFVKTLDLLEEWLIGRNWGYTRIDGSLQGQERQIRIDRFNKHQEHYFVFLLSTRAGGLGINLATADTVIIYDSDWNPHNDLQAMARAHRMGQKKPVMVYRLVTRKSVEEKMMQQAKQKLMLEHLVVRKIGGGKQDNSLKQDELDQVIRYGAEDLFKEDQTEAKDDGVDTDKTDQVGEGDGKHPDKQQLQQQQQQSINNLHGRIVYSDEDIEKLIDRSDLENVQAEEGDEDDDNDFMNAFRVANFEIKQDEEEEEEEGQGEKGAAKQDNEKMEEEDQKQNQAETEADNTSFWQGVMGQSVQDFLHHQHLEQTAQMAQMGRGKRERKQVTYFERDPDIDPDIDPASPPNRNNHTNSNNEKDPRPRKTSESKQQTDDEDFKIDAEELAVLEDHYDEDFIQSEMGTKRAMYRNNFYNINAQSGGESAQQQQQQQLLQQRVKRFKGQDGQALFVQNNQVRDYQQYLLFDGAKMFNCNL
eukprot:TRINITY_DN32457_c0_g3_i1.p2 TRINITY_DN32457_c0_g3~~TRINITY_DN32457_c0_g3_i1.p2  ORF type:complete len:580 (-),score=111.51 TRINITY_DN32457_c0_g3_i1:134-1873(-)